MKPVRPNLRQVISSVLAAMFGVQSAKVRERDFTRGNPLHYVIVGIIMVVVLVLLIYIVVQGVIALAKVN